LQHGNIGILWEVDTGGIHELDGPVTPNNGADVLVEPSTESPNCDFDDAPCTGALQGAGITGSSGG